MKLGTSSILQSPILARYLGLEPVWDEVTHDFVHSCSDKSISVAQMFGLQEGDAYEERGQGAIIRCHDNPTADSFKLFTDAARQPESDRADIIWCMGHADCRYIDDFIRKAQNGMLAQSGMETLMGGLHMQFMANAIKSSRRTAEELLLPVTAALQLASGVNAARYNVLAEYKQHQDLAHTSRACGLCKGHWPQAGSSLPASYKPACV